MASIPCAIHLYTLSPSSSTSAEPKSRPQSQPNPVEKLIRKSFGWVRAAVVRPKVGPSTVPLDQNDIDQGYR